MRQFQVQITVATRGRRLYDISAQIGTVLQNARLNTGVMTLFCHHTSASLLIQENADHDVQRDLIAFFDRLVPDGDALFKHKCEGADDMPSHIKAALTATSLSIPFQSGRLALGTWQAVYLFEHRLAPHNRVVTAHAIGS